MKSTNLIKTKEKSEENEDEEELVAVLAAAIAASRGIDISNVKINSIKRIPQDTPIWAKVGRQEQIFNKL